VPLLRQQIDLPAALGDRVANDSATARLLGFDVAVPRTVEEFYRSREGRLVG
jgi:uncharacterized protein (DUF362 family)